MSENDGDHRGAHAGRLGLAAGLNTAFGVVQIIVGLAIGSVVVLADAAHQAVDALGLITAFVAVRVSMRPVSERWSYGMGKADALGGFTSALLLLASVGWIVVESIRRLVDPEPVDGSAVVLIGVLATVVNALGVVLVGHGHGDEALSLRAARLHLLTDLAGSIVVVLAGIGLATGGPDWIDPVASLLICLAVLWTTWRLVVSATSILLDRSPGGLQSADLAAVLNEHRDVDAAHHVHLRSLGGGRRSASAHVVVDGAMTAHRSQQVIDELGATVQHRFDIDHLTVQVECLHHCDDDPDC